MKEMTRWKSLLLDLGAVEFARDTYAELHALYSEPHRAYHNLTHVVDCLGHLDRYATFSTDPVSLELAIWYHDAIYSPLRADNEEASARLARKRLIEMGLSGALVNEVESLIIVTKHCGEPSNRNESLMLDIDLAILGSDKDIFKAYETAIRQEYKTVPWALYSRKRKAILETFLNRGGIYSTEPFLKERESLARDNLKWAISKL